MVRRRSRVRIPSSAPKKAPCLTVLFFGAVRSQTLFARLHLLYSFCPLSADLTVISSYSVFNGAFFGAARSQTLFARLHLLYSFCPLWTSLATTNYYSLFVPSFPFPLCIRGRIWLSNHFRRRLLGTLYFPFSLHWVQCTT